MEPTKDKRLGQHFLREPRIARRILDAAELAPHHRVLEVGPGGGVLTRELLLNLPHGQLTAVEADPRFYDLLMAEKMDRLDLHLGDALQVDLQALGPFDRIVANLPYQISGPITFRFLELLQEQGWGRAVLMFQKEFADRLLAGPGTKDYGRLSVHVARLVEVSKVRDVPPGCFDPPPKVHSTVVLLVPHEAPPFEVEDEKLFRAVVDVPFQQRRKQLRNTLPPAVASFGIPKEVTLEVLEAMDLLSTRPEQVSPEQFGALTNALGARRA